MQILVTGGAGYIGCVTVHKLVKKGYSVIVIDNLICGHKEMLPKTVKFYHGNIGNLTIMNKVFSENKITHVIHCAAFTDVNESMKDPTKYFSNNIANPTTLLNIMVKYNCKNIIFSSTCATYGIPDILPLNENNPQNPINVYGYTKLVFEQMLEYMTKIHGFNCTILRYFNVAGAYIDENTIVGEDHNPETHLIPLAIKAIMYDTTFNIYGTNYDTKDGTCIRDYIHVEDLADAHILALDKSGKYNLGSEQGYTVKEIIDTIQKIANKEININYCKRREGDADVLYADSTKIKKELGWTPKHNIESIIESAYKWHTRDVPMYV